MLRTAPGLGAARARLSVPPTRAQQVNAQQTRARRMLGAAALPPTVRLYNLRPQALPEGAAPARLSPKTRENGAAGRSQGQAAATSSSRRGRHRPPPLRWALVTRNRPAGGKRAGRPRASRYSPSTQDGRFLVVPATFPGRQEHLTVWDRSSMRFLLQHRCAAITSHVPPSGKRGSTGTRLGTAGIRAGLRGRGGLGETGGCGLGRCGSCAVLSQSARWARVVLGRTTGVTALSPQAESPDVRPLGGCAERRGRRRCLEPTPVKMPPDFRALALGRSPLHHFT